MTQPGPLPGAIAHMSRCPVCGKRVATHPQCSDCGIMVGPEHLEPVSYRGLCGACARWREKRTAG
jgi:ribosomal protein L32